MYRYDPDELEVWVQVAHRLADVARAETLKHFRNAGFRPENKADDGFDPVTEGDRAAEAAMRRVLETVCPEDGIVGEEYGIRDGRSGRDWVLDPIDGTRSYMIGAPTWGTLIALVDQDGPILGVIDQPHIGERFLGQPNRAVLFHAGGERVLRTRNTQRLEDALLTTTFPEIGTSEERQAYEAVMRTVHLTRYGMDCYGYALLAMGGVDLVIEAGLQIYDILAPVAVIEAAGGCVTDWEGRPVRTGGRVVAAASKELHAAALSRLQVSMSEVRSRDQAESA